MNPEFLALVEELYEKCGHNLSEVSRRTGLSLAYLHQTLSGAKASRDPHTATWAKILRALGRDPSMSVREGRGTYGDRFSLLAEWLRNHPEHWPAFVALAKGFGYQEGGGE